MVNWDAVLAAGGFVATNAGTNILINANRTASRVQQQISRLQEDPPSPIRVLRLLIVLRGAGLVCGGLLAWFFSGFKLPVAFLVLILVNVGITLSSRAIKRAPRPSRPAATLATAEDDSGTSRADPCIVGADARDALPSLEFVLHHLEPDEEIKALIRASRFHRHHPTSHLVITTRRVASFKSSNVSKLGLLNEVRYTDIATPKIIKILGPFVRLKFLLHSGKYANFGAVGFTDAIDVFGIIVDAVRRSSPDAPRDWHLHAPPDWEVPQEGWIPHAGWRPDPQWPKCPTNWQLCGPAEDSSPRDPPGAPFAVIPSFRLGALLRIGGWSLRYLGIMMALVPLAIIAHHPVFSGLLTLEFAGLYVFNLGRRMDRHGRQYLTPILQPDHEPRKGSFVLYLRSFDQDDELSKLDTYNELITTTLFSNKYLQSLLTQEEQMISALRRIGPVLAIGRPGEHLPQVGAVRTYRPADEWQDTVESFLHRARFVFLVLGTSDGLAWELGRALDIVAPERLALAVFMDSRSYEWLRRRFPSLPDHPSSTSIQRGNFRTKSWIITFDSYSRAKVSDLRLDDQDLSEPAWKQFERRLTTAFNPIAKHLDAADDAPAAGRRRSLAQWAVKPPAIYFISLLLFTTAMVAMPRMNLTDNIVASSAVFVCGSLWTMISAIRSGQRDTSAMR